MSYPSLSRIVLETIDLYSSHTDLPRIDLTQFHTPLVVGSNNGYSTGRILFRNTPAYFAVESEVDSKLENIPSITDVVIVSASGEKHAPIILEAAKRHGKRTFLISSSEESTGRSMADRSIIMPKIREPYTYNTSTYFGYMLAETPDIDLVKLREFLTGELSHALSFRTEWNEVRNPARNHTSLLSFSEGESDSVITSWARNFSVSEDSEQDVPTRGILPISHSLDMTDSSHLSFRAEAVAEVEKSHSDEDLPTRGILTISTSVEMTGSIDFSQFSSFFLVIPDEFVLLREMFEVKFIELFGRKVARDIFSYEQMKHATTVVQDSGELFLCFGNDTWVVYGEHQINLPIFDTKWYAAMMLVGYYVIGLIQESLPPYFADSIEDYCVRAKALSGFDIKAWVEVW